MFKEATSFFISNIPFEFSSGEIRKEIESMGSLVDLFLSKRLDKHGHRFGFARFNWVMNISKLEEALNNMFMGGRKVYAKVAKFAREDSGINLETTHNRSIFGSGMKFRYRNLMSPSQMQ